jgi:hypothetical protein
MSPTIPIQNAEDGADLIPTLVDSMRIIPYPEEKLVDVDHTILRLFTEFCVKTVHPQCVDVVGIRKIFS